MLAGNGIVHVEVEGLPDWWSDGVERARSDEPRRFLLRATEALGVKLSPDTSGAPWNPDHWAAEFALLAGQAPNAGARLGIEFLPWSNIRTVHDALRPVEDAGHPAGGIVVDVWHVERAATPVTELATVPPHRIVAVETVGRRNLVHRAPPARRPAGRRARRDHGPGAARHRRRRPVTAAASGHAGGGEPRS
jgi:sugar phosphate isomerase/epimerase